MEEKLKSRFLCLYCMVMADGIVEAKELETLYRIGKENYKLSEEEINEAIVSSGTSFVAPTNIEEKISILYEMSEIAWADGNIDDSERNLLQKYAIRMGFKEENSKEIATFMLEQVKAGTSLDAILSELKN